MHERGVCLIVDESWLGADQSSSSVVMRMLLVMTLSTVVLLIVVRFVMELVDWLAFLDLVIQAHIGLGVSELLSSLFQGSLILCAPTRNTYISEFLKSALDNFGVFCWGGDVAELLLAFLDGLFVLLYRSSKLFKTLLFDLLRMKVTRYASSIVASVPKTPNLSLRSFSFSSSESLETSSKETFCDLGSSVLDCYGSWGRTCSKRVRGVCTTGGGACVTGFGSSFLASGTGSGFSAGLSCVSAGWASSATLLAFFLGGMMFKYKWMNLINGSAYYEQMHTSDLLFDFMCESRLFSF